jgi:type IV secretory pathway VirB4 component
MWKLKTYRTSCPGMTDLLRWGLLASPGIVMTKDGSFLAGFYFRPPDSASSSDEAQAHISARMNEALLHLGTGWSIWTDVVSIEASEYPPPFASFSPDPVSRMVDEERRRRFEAEGTHFENERAFLLCYTPPMEQVSKLEALFYNDKTGKRPTTLTRILEGFGKALEQIEDQIGGLIGLRRMESYKVVDSTGRAGVQDELVNYLHYCVTGKPDALMLPAAGCYLDSVIGGQECETGETPIIGGEYICCIAIDGFPAEHYPNILASLSTLAIPYRFSQRMIFLDGTDAIKEINSYKKKWAQKTISMLAAVMGRKPATATSMRSKCGMKPLLRCPSLKAEGYDMATTLLSSSSGMLISRNWKPGRDWWCDPSPNAAFMPASRRRTRWKRFEARCWAKISATCGVR